MQAFTIFIIILVFMLLYSIVFGLGEVAVYTPERPINILVSNFNYIIPELHSSVLYTWKFKCLNAVVPKFK